MTAEFEDRIGVGWISKATLEGSDSYLLTNQPVQADQISITRNPWGPPADHLTTYPVYTRTGQFSSTTQWADGPLIFDWGWGYFTELMLKYWENLLFGGTGLYANSGVQNAQVTVKTMISNGDFIVVQCYANRAAPGVDYKRGYRGVEDYRQHFVGGVEIFA
jgi:hypothetical protein